MSEKHRDVEPVLHDSRQTSDSASTPAQWDETLPIDTTASRVSLSEKPGSEIGNYRLLKQIGEGGFGTVFMAEQRAPVQRKVALKIIKLGMDTRQVIARFEAERQALAMMDHANIAKVLDAGATNTGRPYFVMELVTGDPITTYADERQMTIPQRLHLFIQVCHAVQHAHHKGVIHRDLKPSNVLVSTQDDRPHVKVIDFGIAKATEQRLTDRTLFTELGQFIGTPAYMSPEQAERSGLDVDTRSDVYSLGVLLYELLTGTTPFDTKTLRGANLTEIQRMIREHEPQWPSTRLSTLGNSLPGVAQLRGLEPRKLGTALRGDLDWIIMKALEKDRTRRYETVSGFAMDIERFLNDEPVEATPPSAAYRFRKFARRNRVPLTMAAVFGFAVLAGLGVSAYGLVQATRERDAKVQALEATESALDREKAALAEQRNARSESDAVADFLGSMLIAAAPHEQGRETTVRSVLDAAAGGVSTRFAEQPLVQARIHYLITSTYQSLGLYPEAEQHARASLATRRQILGNDHPDTLAALMALAWTLQDQGRYPEADPLFAEMRENLKKTGASTDLNVLWSKNQLATSHMQAGRYREAEALYLDALSVFEQLLGKKDRKTLSLMNNLVVLYWNQGQLDRARQLAKETYELMVDMGGPEDPLTIAMLTNLAILQHAVGDFAASEQSYLTALALHDRVVGESHINSVTMRSNLVVLYNDTKQYDKAEAFANQVLAMRGKTLDEDHQMVLATTINLGIVYAETQRLELAIKLLQDLLPRALSKFGAQHPWTWEAQEALSNALLRADREEEAEVVRREMLAALTAAAETNVDDANVLDRLARMLLQDKPESLHDKAGALRAANRAVERSSRKNAAHLHTLAQALFQTGDVSAAMAAEQEAMALLSAESVHRAVYQAALSEFEASYAGSAEP